MKMHQQEIVDTYKEYGDEHGHLFESLTRTLSSMVPVWCRYGLPKNRQRQTIAYISNTTPMVLCVYFA